MRITAIVAFVAVVLIEPAPIAAQEPTNGLPPKAPPFGSLFAPSSTPSSATRFLFPTPTFNQPPDARTTPATKPTVVCGLTVIPADPNVDPGIRHEVPEGGPRYQIRSVDPKVCRRP
jgi:hypothetical protein